jgi:hypothetical protein
MKFTQHNDIIFPKELRAIGFKDASYGNDETAKCIRDNLLVWCYNNRYIVCSYDSVNESVIAELFDTDDLFTESNIINSVVDYINWVTIEERKEQTMLTNINVKAALTSLRLFFMTREQVDIGRECIIAALASLKITDINDDELDFIVDHL